MSERHDVYTQDPQEWRQDRRRRPEGHGHGHHGHDREGRDQEVRDRHDHGPDSEARNPEGRGWGHRHERRFDGPPTRGGRSDGGRRDRAGSDQSGPERFRTRRGPGGLRRQGRELDGGELRIAVRTLVGAIRQVALGAGDEQRRSALSIIDGATRSIYGVLAAGAEPTVSVTEDSNSAGGVTGMAPVLTPEADVDDAGAES